MFAPSPPELAEIAEGVLGGACAWTASSQTRRKMSGWRVGWSS